METSTNVPRMIAMTICRSSMGLYIPLSTMICIPTRIALKMMVHCPMVRSVA